MSAIRPLTLTGAAVITVTFIALLTSPHTYKPSTEDDPYNEAVDYEIVSPSGTEIAIKHYAPGFNDKYSLTIARRGRDGRLQGAVDWTRLERSGLGKLDNVLLNWDGDTRVTVAGPSENATPFGPDYLGDVRVSYTQYVRGKIDLHGPRSSVVTLVDVTHSVRRIALGDGTGKAVICSLRAEGRDDQFHRLVGFDVNALGFLDHHIPNPMLSGTAAEVVFATTYLPEATDRPTLTQGIVPDFPVYVDPYSGPHGPIQNDTRADIPNGIGTGASELIRHGVIYMGAFYPRATAGILDLLRAGRFEAVFEFGLGAQVVTYRFTTPVPRAVAEQFAACEATTNIDPSPNSLSRHLIQ